MRNPCPSPFDLGLLKGRASCRRSKQREWQGPGVDLSAGQFLHAHPSAMPCAAPMCPHPTQRVEMPEDGSASQESGRPGPGLGARRQENLYGYVFFGGPLRPPPPTSSGTEKRLAISYLSGMIKTIARLLPEPSLPASAIAVLPGLRSQSLQKEGPSRRRAAPTHRDREENKHER